MNGNSLVKNSLVKPSTAAITGAGLLMLAVYASGVALPFLFPPAWSCVGFVAIGIALWLGNEGFEHRIERRIDHPRTLPLTILIIGSAGLVLLIGVVSWSEYLAGKDFGLDRLLFPGSILKTVQHPGRPSPATGFNLALLGLGLLLITSKKPVGIVIREVSAVASFTFSYLTGASYLLSSASVSVSRELIVPITAVLLLAASASLVFSSSEGYLVPLLRNAGPAGVFARWLMPVPLILPLVASLVRMAGGRLGILDARTSGPIISFLDILVAILIVWRSSSQVLEADKLRREAEAKVTKSRDDLDIRVSVRTAELLQANRQLEAEISERKRAEGELQQVNATLSTVIAASPLGICVFNRDRTIRQRNSAAETMLISAEHEFDDLINRAGRGENIAGAEITLTSQGGPPVHVSVWASPLPAILPATLPAAEGMYDGVLIMAADVSERKALEIQMRQTQKLESLGVLAGGIAHDFNNLLTGVMGNASLALDALAAHHPSRSFLQQVQDASQRAADLTRQLLAYAGKGRFVMESVNVSGLVREISSLIQTSIPRTVHLRLELNANIPGIEADASQIQQIVMNLVINGAEAIAESGTVVVTTDSQELDEPYIRNYLAGEVVKPGKYITLEVTDTGSGMDEATKARIFDPFFTTKFTGRGLGLAAVQGIVRGHKGALRVYTSVGHGTTFKLFFPVAAQQGEMPVRSEPDRWDVAGRGTILVIDDEPVVRQMARNALERFGFHVEVAENGEEGLVAFENAPGEVTAVLLDLTMPGLSGQETFRRLKLINPQVPVILSSGFNEMEVVRHFTGRGLAGFIQKPYTTMQLAARLKDVLQGAESAGTSSA